VQQSFGDSTTFIGVQNFTGANTFGNNVIFGTGQNFTIPQFFGDNANFTGMTDFADNQIFTQSTNFADSQEFPENENVTFADFTTFGSDTTFGKARIFGDNTLFVGVQNFADTNTFGDGISFGDGQTFAVPQNFGDAISFGKNTNFTDTQNFGIGTKFDGNTAFAAGQSLDSGVIPSYGLLLDGITCGTNTDGTCMPDDTSKFLAPGDILLPGVDPDIISNTITSTTKSLNIPGLGFEMSFSNVIDGTVNVDPMDPNTIPGSAAGDVSGSRSISAGNTRIDTIGSIFDVSLDTVISTGTMSITLPYTESNIPAGVAEEKLHMVHYTENSWVAENDCTVDTISNTITCTVMTLSPFGIGAESSGTVSSSNTSSNTSISSGSSGGGGRTGVDVSGNTNSIGSPTSSDAIAKLQESKNNTTLQNNNNTQNEITKLDASKSDMSNEDQSQNNNDFKINLSPKQQVINGVAHDQIICIDGLQLVFKLSDGSPACVKEQSIPKLIQWGWAKITV